ncbi:MAG TPA: bile acid:sodium symporter family protein [Polyangiaceae bacterium]|nr:bile acid:sodium symporter family protein [Polyangiaceae bacterium]
MSALPAIAAPAAPKKKLEWFLPGIVIAIALAWLFPDPGAKGGALHPELTNKLGVALIFFLHGLLLSFAALRAGTLLWRLHLVVQLATYAIFPLIGLGALALIGDALDPSLSLGIFYLCALPSTVSSSVAMTAAARGNVAAAVFNATLSSVLGVFLTPLWMGAVIGATGGTLPLGKVVLDLVLWLMLPLALGQLARPLLGAFATRHKPKVIVVDRLTILLLVYTAFCDSVKAGVWLGSGASSLLATLLFSMLLLAVLLTLVNAVCKLLGFSTEDRIAAVFCGSKKTLASGVPMARLMFAGHAGLSLILLPIMIYHQLQLVVCGWLAGRFAARIAR